MEILNEKEFEYCLSEIEDNFKLENTSIDEIKRSDNLIDKYKLLRKYLKNLDKTEIYEIKEKINRFLFINEEREWQKQGISLGLNRMNKLLKLLDNPEDYLKVIHVGGTNGKGSTSAYLQSILKESGLKVGLFTSPSVISNNDGIRINDDFISFEDGYDYLSKIKSIWLKNYGEDDFITYFEAFTAMALLYFKDKNVDFAIFEVGLGGRYDATNIFKKKVLSVITNIGIDHIGILGNSLEEIAYEKAGIIQKKDHVVAYPSPEDALNIIKKVCREKDAKLTILEKTDIKNISLNSNYNIFSYGKYKNIKTKMVGNYQVYNCALALLCLEKLEEQGLLSISEKNIRNGILKTSWPGRLEWVSDSPRILIDGAHNVDSINNLVSFLKKLKYNKLKILMGVLKDKEYDEIFKIISSLDAEFYLTEVPYESRKMTVDEMKKVLKKYTEHIYTFKNPEDALNVILKGNSENNVIVLTGSFYLISKLRNKLINKEQVID
ncbi:bifunctional folylpolyglutamate synthase/dihydrofolate synthase [Miniphocaeibacter halophilus]|uniref:Bifunctional folylpolyglutamate synthase/dihydrofolate synthase n=1 Tax=Miniphocaeibacter halophilus TaxID=2931922 RepID=A0AC61MS40_9FIRM|nr:folylpolyglutamate synthase/dihydrofolate synthase family protein [Miniphocaeibacter halophilus]QQK07231.1 bifunctional folylpolyglutamate synthase/dihydrofolate synthase [Miniphocaeibacter halophilus]